MIKEWGLITVMVTAIFLLLYKIYLIADQKIENRLICHKHFEVLDHRTIKDRLFCKVDNKWLEVAEEK